MACFAFNVWHGSKMIDTVFNTINAGQTIAQTVEEVRRGLISHDGYPHDIRVTWPKGQRLTRNMYELRGRYPGPHGEEVLCSEETRKEARERLREYRENDNQVSGLRIVCTRERI